MAFQTTVASAQSAGVPGEHAYSGPGRAKPWLLVSTPQLNVVGATAYTYLAPGEAQAGGTGEFIGVLVNPKVYANYSTGLAPTLTLPDDTIGELATMGTFFLTLTTAANPGDVVVYNTTTGVLSSIAFGSTPGTGFAGIGGKVILQPSAANGLAIVEMTNIA